MSHNANLYDSLGEAYLANEKYGKSAAAYRKSLELNPENEGAEQKLKEIAALKKK